MVIASVGKSEADARKGTPTLSTQGATPPHHPLPLPTLVSGCSTEVKLRSNHPNPSRAFKKISAHSGGWGDIGNEAGGHGGGMRTEEVLRTKSHIVPKGGGETSGGWGRGRKDDALVAQKPGFPGVITGPISSRTLGEVLSGSHCLNEKGKLLYGTARNLASSKDAA
eukprot:758493-Hanusia_phi.AAC.6